MKLPNENKVCFFCKYGEKYRPHIHLVWCRNTQAIHARRTEEYGTSQITRVSGESRYSHSHCGSFQEKEGAATEVLKLKLTGEYRKRDHEKISGGSFTSW